MMFLQILGQDEVAQEVSKTFEGWQSNWMQFWKMFFDSPVEALKFLGEHAVGIVTKIIIALVIFYIGRWLIRKIKKVMARIFARRNVDSSARIFLNNMVSILLNVMLLVIIIGLLGLNMTGLVAIFAAAAFAIGMALSGTLSNFAGGVLILLQKPYRLGDYIEAQGFGGTVKAIQLFNTIITTSDNKTIIIPNGPLSTGTINNFSRQFTRRVEWIIGISYGDDFDQAAKIISAILDKDERILGRKGYTIAIGELGSSSVRVVIRCWVHSPVFWDVYYDINRLLYIELPANGINFPSSQMDVRITGMETVQNQMQSPVQNPVQNPVQSPPPKAI